ncbi:SDR family oxidoreductase [Altererythrobacter aerius]|uniref:SDR family oxidoreductase n=1 Tax=Tsuneonella aeria TaxID=1837929 RepID=A0A6I4TEV9_9SPHN|nr:SDR family oxidoreductase [Tsuneonella aeria]MXO75782.1 SDR family oxidoreductase [Tsuneonella aeria]
MTTFRDGLFEGQSAFVAGGTSGINLGIARRLAELGAKVAVCGRDADKALGAAESIGAGAMGLSADVRDYAAIRGALEHAAERHGPLGIVIAGAAGNFLAPALGMSANAFKTVVDIDLLGTFNTFRACHDLLARSPQAPASLIAITAGQADQAMALQVHACAAKAGVNQVVRTLAIEWGPDVRVNGISPGPIAGTEGMERLSPLPGMREASERRIPMKRWGEIGEIADAAVFLCSPAARYITGAILDVDGGSSVGDAGQVDMANGPGR